MRVVPYDTTRRDHRAAFRDLNLAWIEGHFAVEVRDRYELDDPETHILSVAGQIFMAEISCLSKSAASSPARPSRQA